MNKGFKYFLGSIMMLIGFTSIYAQSEEINRVEVFAGYSYLSSDTGLDDDDFEETEGLDSRLGLHGVNLSVTGNFSKYIGAKFDFSTNGKSEDFSFLGDSATVKYRVTQFLGGVQIKNNAKEGPRFKPFGHVLLGVSRQSVKLDDVVFLPTPIPGGSIAPAGTGPVFDDDSFNTNNFATAIGGGLDVRVHKRIDIRAFQVDYNPTFYRDQDFGGGFVIPGRTQNNFRFSFGVVFH